jgi:hypothetical protein
VQVVWAKTDKNLTILVPKSKFVEARNRAGTLLTPVTVGTDVRLTVGFSPIYIVQLPDLRSGGIYHRSDLEAWIDPGTSPAKKLTAACWSGFSSWRYSAAFHGDSGKRLSPRPLPPGQGSQSRPGEIAVGTDSPAPTTIYLPVVARPELFYQDTPIWAHSNAPAPHEVALFRHTFTLDMALPAAELHIFADTRYEVWIDGVWTGRGPARFSRTLREYDVYTLGSLPAGAHLIAVQAQWAPNIPAESVTPCSWAISRGGAGGMQIVARTGPDWKQRSPAWRQGAAAVLLGAHWPDRLLDFSALPATWNQPGFADGSWTGLPSAIPPTSYRPYLVPRLDQELIATQDLLEIARPMAVAAADLNESVVYQPRSIPFLSTVAVKAPAIVDAGVLSPGRLVGEVLPTAEGSYVLSFQAAAATTFTLETLSAAVPPQPERSIWTRRISPGRAPALSGRMFTPLQQASHRIA